jgi:hypothetical protein
VYKAHISWNTNVGRQGISPLLLPHQPHHVKCLTKFITVHPYDKGKHQYHLSPVVIDDIHRMTCTSLITTLLQHFTTLFYHQEISTWGVMLFVAVISIFMVFYHENFSVLVSKGKDWNALLTVIFSLMQYIFFYRARNNVWWNCGWR